MQESLLHFVWRSRLFSTVNLHTTSGDEIIIKNVGVYNLNSGPDFLNAQVKIGNQLWAGNIEIHNKSSQWYEHGHQNDIRYDTVILHVVWEHDLEVFNKSNSIVPTLVLKNITHRAVLKNFEQLTNHMNDDFPCSRAMSTIPMKNLNHWQDRLFVERLEQKTLKLEHIHIKNGQDWEAVLFVCLAEGFGLKVNQESFYNMAEQLPFSIIRKHAHDLHMLEALFFGSAGLLGKVQNTYESQLLETYEFLKKKYDLTALNTGQIQFFRLRPSNFPTIRLAQLAALYYKHKGLFSKIIGSDSIEEIYSIFEIKTSSFWDTHYTFDAVSKLKEKRLTKAFVDLILINIIIPLKYYYFRLHGNFKSDALMHLLEAVNPERNVIISKFDNIGVHAKNALETQSLIQLNNEYCSKKRCLDCDVGKLLLMN